MQMGTEFISRHLSGTSDPYEIKAMEITQKILSFYNRVPQGT